MKTFVDKASAVFNSQSRVLTIFLNGVEYIETVPCNEEDDYWFDVNVDGVEYDMNVQVFSDSENVVYLAMYEVDCDDYQPIDVTVLYYSVFN
jgi:hypothetical protein